MATPTWNKESPLRYVRSHWLLAVLILVAVVARLVAAACVPLMHLEAYYWMYAEHPSLSYYDHPPMVAWVIGLGTWLFGDTEWGVRAVGEAVMLGNAGLMYAFARQWFCGRVAIASTLLFAVLPVYFSLGLLATMNPTLLGFWLLAMIGFSVAVRRGRTWGWYACGVGLGGALLSKYTGAMLLPSVGLLLLLHRPWRRHLTSPHPYAAALLGIALFAPVLVWNWQHDWASFRFQFLDRVARDRASHLALFSSFLGLQVALATPIVLAGAALLTWRIASRRRLGTRDKVALAFAVPLLASVAAKAWSFPVHVDWAAPAYLSLIPAAVQASRVWKRALHRRTGERPSSRWHAVDSTLLTLRVCVAVNIAMLFVLLVVQPRTHALAEFGPWDQLAAKVEHYEDALESQTGRSPLVIVDDKYGLASLIAFYRNRIDAADRASKMTVNRVALDGTSLGYAYWTDRSAWQGMDCICVDEGAGPFARVAERFASVRIVWTGIASNGEQYSIMECRGYSKL